GASRTPTSAAAAACGPGGTPTGGAPMPREAGGFAAQLMGVSPAPARPAGGPDIGGRRNLVGGDHGDGLPGDGPASRRGAPSAQRPTPRRVGGLLRGGRQVGRAPGRERG